MIVIETYFKTFIFYIILHNFLYNIWSKLLYIARLELQLDILFYEFTSYWFR